MSIRCAPLFAAAWLAAAPPAAGQPAEAAIESDAEMTAEPDAASAAEAAAAGPAVPVSAASAADVHPGAVVLDTQGGRVGIIESVEADGAVVAAGEARAKLPLSSFGKTEGALVITMTRAELEAAVAARTPS